MKKLIIILLLFISLSVQAQMKITNHVGESAEGKQVLYRLYETPAPSPYYLIVMHGAGEKGPLDGSLLSRVAKYGYPKHAHAGKIFEFNIVAVQTAESDFHDLMKVFPRYIKQKYDAKVIIVTGLSMGGYGTYFAKYLDTDNIIYAIAPVCGSHSKYPASQWPEMRAWHFHGDLDSTVPLSGAVKFINAYNAVHTSKIRLTVYAGVHHNSWDRAYSVTPGQDELLQQINAWFKEAYPPVPPRDYLAEYNHLKNQRDSIIQEMDSIAVFTLKK